MAYDRREDRSGSGNRRGKGGDRHGFRRRDEEQPRSRSGQGRRRGAGREGFGTRDGEDRYRGGNGRSRRRDDRYGRGAGARRHDGDSRPPQRSRIPEPSVPSDVLPQNLEASARRELRSLGRANAENVARHLVMVQRLLDSDPELAYQHARYAASHAGRVAVVRESAGIAAYLSGHYNEALREIRAARRLSGLDLHRAIEADCERALGRYNQALKVAQEADSRQLDDLEEAELAMVVSGVRHDMGQSELGLVVIEEAIMMFRGDRETLRRLHSVRADRLEELGRGDEAAKIRKRIGMGEEREPAEEVEVYDIEDDYEEDLRAAEEQRAETTADDPQASEAPSAAAVLSETADVTEPREISEAVDASSDADDGAAPMDTEVFAPDDATATAAEPSED